MSRIEVRVIEGNPVRVGDSLMGLGETRAFDTGPSLTVAEETAPVDAAAATADVFDPSNRPNGLMTAAIAPKMPKSSGELAQFPIEGGRTVERAVADIGVATQGGGPDSPDTLQTPGPQPDNTAMGTDASLRPGGGTAATTGAPGDPGGTGTTSPRAGAHTATKAPARTATKTATKSGARKGR